MIKQIKLNAKKIIKPKKIDLALITFTILCIALVILVGKYFLSLFFNLKGYVDIYETPIFYLDDVPNTSEQVYLFSLSALFVLFTVLHPMILAAKRWCYALINTSKVSYKNLYLFFYNEYLKAVLFSIHLYARKIICFMICFLPAFLSTSIFFFLIRNSTTQIEIAIGGLFLIFSMLLFVIGTLLFIVMIQKYNLAAYLAFENKVSICKSLKSSAVAMKEYKLQFLYLYIRFSHLLIMCVFFFPIFYVIPYMHISFAVLSKYIICEKEKEILEVINKKQKDPKLSLI